MLPPSVASKLSFPEPLFQRLQRYVASHPEEGYASASELLKDLARRFIEDREDPPEHAGPTLRQQEIDEAPARRFRDR